jgi:hypothetical protein
VFCWIFFAGGEEEREREREEMGVEGARGDRKGWGVGDKTFIVKKKKKKKIYIYKSSVQFSSIP